MNNLKRIVDNENSKPVNCFPRLTNCFMKFYPPPQIILSKGKKPFIISDMTVQKVIRELMKVIIAFRKALRAFWKVIRPSRFPNSHIACRASWMFFAVPDSGQAGSILEITRMPERSLSSRTSPVTAARCPSTQTEPTRGRSWRVFCRQTCSRPSCRARRRSGTGYRRGLRRFR